MATQLLKTVKPSGGDYTSLEACLNANEQNLVTADKYFDIEIDGTWSSADTTSVVIENYTTDATRYINIYTTSAARHNGTFSTGYVLAPTGSPWDAVTYSFTGTSIYIRFTGLAIKSGSTTSTGITCFYFYAIWGTNDILIQKCLLSHGSSYGSGHAGINGAATVGPIKLYNNFFVGFDNNGNAFSISPNLGGTVTWYVYNNTVLDCTDGMKLTLRDGATLNVILKNNISYNCGTACYTLTDGADWHADSTNNLASDATTPEKNTYYDSKTLTFVSTVEGSEDLHLVAGDTDAIDKGADLSGTFTDDIDGTTRSGTWDIGADEYVAAGTSVSPAALSITSTQPSPSISGAANVALSALSLGLTLLSPTVSTSSATTVYPDALSISATQLSPAVTGAANISPAALSLSATQLSPAVTGAGNISPSALSLSATQLSPAVTGTAIVSPAALSLTVSQLSPSFLIVSGNIILYPSALSLTASQLEPSVVLTIAGGISVASISGTFSLLDPTVTIADASTRWRTVVRTTLTTSWADVDRSTLTSSWTDVDRVPS